MEENKHHEGFDERQSLHVISEIIKVSQRKLKSDGILIVLWGWIMTIHYLTFYLVEKLAVGYRLNRISKYTAIGLVLGGLAYTIFYLVKEHRKVQTYIGVSLRYIWISMFVSMVIINLIQNNVLHEIIFELQHPIFMTIIAFAIVATGGILRYRLIIIGGAIFGLLALISSYLPLPDQLLVEAVAWFVAFVIPGHMLYANRNK